MQTKRGVEAFFTGGVFFMALAGVLAANRQLGLGRLPGDLRFRGPRGTVLHLPIVTTILVSVFLTLVVAVALRLRG
jgi:hypothetical protein